MNDQPLVSSIPQPPTGTRSWHNMSDPVERLQYMRSCNCVTIEQLQVLLAVGQAGGNMDIELLKLRSGVHLESALRTILAILAEKRGNSEGVVVYSDDAKSVWLTSSGHEACERWNAPLSALCAAKISGDDVLKVKGKVSYFGGPKDTGVSASENLALFDRVPAEGQRGHRLFLLRQPDGTTGTARRLNTDMPYIAMRWAYREAEKGMDTNNLGRRLEVVTPRAWLLGNMVKVRNPKTGEFVWAWPCDWGPNGRTNRVADVSPFVMQALGLQTDDEVEVEIPRLAV